VRKNGSLLTFYPNEPDIQSEAKYNTEMRMKIIFMRKKCDLS